MTTFEKVRNLIDQEFATTGEITPSSTLASLGFDSLDEVELSMAIEDEFELDDDIENAPCATVADIVAYLDNHDTV